MEPSVRALLPTARAIAMRPSLWRVAVVQCLRLAPSGWWRRPPFLPVPDEAYMRFRTSTMYGKGDGATQLEPDDVLTWLGWCKRWPSIAA